MALGCYLPWEGLRRLPVRHVRASAFSLKTQNLNDLRTGCYLTRNYGDSELV